MSKIGDLVVKLKLDGDEYKKGLKSASKETESFGGGLDKIFGKGGLKAIGGWGAAIVAACKLGVKAYKDLAEQGQQMYDNLQRKQEGLRAAWDEFKDHLVGVRADSLVDSLREAVKHAKDLYNAMDAVGEVSTSRNIFLATHQEQINNLRIALRNQNLSKEERRQAGQQLLDIYHEAESSMTNVLGKVETATIDKYLQKVGTSLEGKTASYIASMEKQFVEFMEWLGSEKGQEIYGFYTANAGKTGMEAWAKNQAQTLMERSGLGHVTAQNYAYWMRGYDKNISDKDRGKIEAAVVNYYNQIAAFSEETMRIQTQINSLDAADAKVVKTKKDDIKDIDDTLTKKHGTIDTSKALTSLSLPSEASTGGLAQQDGYWAKYWQENGDSFDDYIKRLQDGVELYKDIAADFKEACIEGFADSTQYLTDVLFGLEDFNVGTLFQNLLEPLADFAVKSGELMMSYGAGLIATEKAITNPYAALAAGAALVALGSAAKSGLQALSNSFASGSTSSGSTASSTTDTSISSELTIYVKGTISGGDIVLSGQKTLNKWSR